MVSINEAIAEDLTSLAVDVARFNKTIQRSVLYDLEELKKEIEAQLYREDVPSALTRYQESRLKQLRREVDRTIDKYYDRSAATLKRSLLEVGTFTQAQAVKAFNKAFTYNITRPTITAGELRTLAQDPIVYGNRLSEHWTKQTGNLKHRFAQQMRLGISSGETNQQLVHRLIGKSTRATRLVERPDGTTERVRVRTGGIMQASEREAMALVRTSAQAVSSKTLEGVYKDNADIIDAIALIVTLDGRTTIICLSLEGGEWDVLTGAPLERSPVQDPYPGPPPYHWQCRTVVTAVTKSWEQLGSKAKKEVNDKAAKPDSTRASMDGKVPGKTTFDQFLRKKDEKFQNSVLGKGRADLWRAGKIELHQLTDATLRPLTLKELRQIAGS